MPPQTSKKTSKLNALLAFDRGVKKALNEHIALIGADEVGRGSLIGPIVAASIILPEKLTPAERKALAALNDSKQVSAEARAELAAFLTSNFPHGIGIAEKQEVDTLNVHYASLLAAYRAFESVCEQAGLAHDNTHLLLDGRAVMNDLPRHRQQAVIKGDGKSACIAAASIIAKEHRDSWVRTIAVEYPGYGWETNMGYGTPAHQQAMSDLGLTPLHRLNYKLVQNQLTLELTEPV